MENTLRGETSLETRQIPRPSASPGREPPPRSPLPPRNSFEREPSPFVRTTGTTTQDHSTNEGLNSFNEDLNGFNENSLHSNQEIPPPPQNLPPAAILPDLTESLEFVQMVKDATLESQLDPEDLDRLWNPTPHSSTPADDPDLLLSISTFIDLMNSSQDAYDNICENIRRRNPEIDMLSYARAKRSVQNLSGIITLEDDMCVNSCVAFTGPYADLDCCPTPECWEPRYDPEKYRASDGQIKVPRRKFTTFPVGPQIQARWKHPEMAEKMLYRQRRTEAGVDAGSYNDILDGEAYLEAVEDGRISGYDTCLMLSIDGAQLYRDKKSECWIYIWILLDLGPDERYKVRNILPGGIIPGPKGPKHLDSFLFPGVAHISALQKEGLKIWDSFSRNFALSMLFVFLVLADAVAMAKLTRSVGHHGRRGCRLLCGMEGRNKKGGSHFYPAMLRPEDCDDNPSADHPDYDVNDLPPVNTESYRWNLNYVLASPTITEFKTRHLQTGITKPSIFDGLPRILKLPTCFPGDLMHQPMLNLPDLLVDLWCQRRDLRKHDKDSDWPWAVLTGDTWVEHGMAVAEAGRFLPRSFDRVPRNPQEKISSGYKAWEFLIYMYVLGPGLFYNILLEPYYRHYCKLVRGIRLVHQRSISREQLATAHQTLLEYSLEFEHLYYQRKSARLHFVRQSVHSLTHLAPETHRLGPLSLSAQWTMERVIGVLGSLVKQPSNPFANLTEQAKKMAGINSLLAMWPQIGHKQRQPRGSIDLGGGFILLGPTDDKPHDLSPSEHAALNSHQTRSGSDAPTPRSVHRWARLQLPNGQVARSHWKEVVRSQRVARTDRMLKVRPFHYMIWLLYDTAQITHQGTTRFCEARFYFRVGDGDVRETLALVSLYSVPDEAILERSYGTLTVCEYQDDAALTIVGVKSIEAVVGMVPFGDQVEGHNPKYFLAEKLGLEVYETVLNVDEDVGNEL